MVSQNLKYEIVIRNKIYAMKLRLWENLRFEIKIQFKNHSIYVVKLPPFPPGMGTGGQNFGDGGPGDGYFFSHPGVRNSMVSCQSECYFRD